MALSGASRRKQTPSSGTDYYQNQILWGAPAALAGQDIAGPCKPGGLVERVIQSAKAK